jgi:starch-binding outer membrane protein, SusD/RagB family
MYKNLYKWLFLIVAIAGLSSCKKWLDLRPADGIVSDSFWKTKEQLSSAVNGIYASLIGRPPGVSDRSLAEYLFMWGELRADMVMPSTGATNEDIEINNVNILPTNSIVNWRSVYRTINYCNTVIDLGPTVMESDKTLTQEQLNSYLSEAYAIRGLMYFYLVRSFGEVPIKLNATTSDENIEQLPKSSKDSVLKQIVSDLTMAAPMAVTTYGSMAKDKGKITKYTISAILADVYLWMERYEDCIAECNKIITSNQFSLVAGNVNWNNILFIDGNSSESIFEFQYDQQALNPFFNMFLTSRRKYQATDKVMEDIFTIDYTNPDNFDYRGDNSSMNSSSNSIMKFVWNSTADASYNHWIVYRYADILLMKAEALNQLDMGQEALDIVYRIRRRGNALAETDINSTSKDDIADFILAERARELAFEGKRWYDILRNAKRNNYEREYVLLDIITTTVPKDRQQSAVNKYKDHNSHYFPIYFYELQTDKNLVQNPFYN